MTISLPSTILNKIHTKHKKTYEMQQQIENRIKIHKKTYNTHEIIIISYTNNNPKKLSGHLNRPNIKYKK